MQLQVQVHAARLPERRKREARLERGCLAKEETQPKMQYCDFIAQIAYNHPATTGTRGLQEGLREEQNSELGARSKLIQQKAKKSGNARCNGLEVGVRRWAVAMATLGEWGGVAPDRERGRGKEPSDRDRAHSSCYGNGIKIIFPFYYLLLMKMQIKLDFPCGTKRQQKQQRQEQQN